MPVPRCVVRESARAVDVPRGSALMQFAERTRRWRHRLTPPVFHTHANYGLVIVAEAILHAWLGFAGLTQPHAATVWLYIGGAPGVVALGAAHTTAAAVMLYSLYFGSWRVMRAVLLLSVTIYVFSSVAFFVAWVAPLIDPGLPSNAAEGIALQLFPAIVSTAALREPLVPGSYLTPNATT